MFFFNNRHLILLYSVSLLITLLTYGCMANDDESRSLNNEPPDSYKKLSTPVVAAYLYIGNRTLDVRTIQLDGVDIVNLAFTVIKNNRMGLQTPADAANFGIARKLKQKYPNIKVLVSCGGYGTQKDFSQMAMDSLYRTAFVDDAVRFVRSYGMDGLDLDWEFPGMTKATRSADKENFTKLVSELRAAFNTASQVDGKKYYLTVAAGAFELYLSFTEPHKVCPMVDYFFVMTYDFYGQWNKHTGHHTNLYASSLNPGSHSVNRIVEKYINAGIPPSKIVIGSAFYGREWNQTDNVNNGLYRAGKGVGSISYRKIASLTTDAGYRRYWDKSAMAPYLYNTKTNTFISYDDRESVKRKVNYVYIHGLGGMMYWEHFSDNNGELARSIISEMAIRKEEYAHIKMPGGFIAKKTKK